MSSSISLSALTPTMSTGSDYGTSKGHIQLIMGPMFSGKSTELIRRLKRYQIARYECLIVRYAKDNRYADASIATHDRQSLLAVSASTAAELRDRASKYDVIGVDEGQFFPDITQFCEDMANLGKIVLVAALDGTFQRKGFQNIMELVPLAEHVVKLKAVCMSCFGDGSYTKRLSEDQEVEVIGGADKYMAVCRRCYFSDVKIPASPRIPLKAVGTNGVSNGSNGHCDDEGVSPPKKSLFVEEKEGGGIGKENGGLALGAK